MNVIEIPVVLDSTQFSHESHVRTAGLHLSHIIRSMEEDIYGLLKGDGMDQQDLEAYRIAGFLFEHGLYNVILKDDQVERLGEFELDGIIMTPDAINLTRGRGVESKCTFRSMKHDVLDQTGEFGSWWIQIMGYAKCLGMLNWDLYTMFMRGDYGKVRRPVLKHWEIDFEQDEVDHNWRRIRNHATWMKETGRVS